MNITKSVLSFFVLILLLTAISTAEEKPEYVIKLAAIAPEGTQWSDVGKEFADMVYKNTGGQVRVVFYLGGVMGDEPDVIRKIKLGQLQGGIFTAVGLEKIVPEIRVLTLPNLFRNYEEVDYVLQKLTPTFKKLFDERGFVLFGWVEVGFAYFFSTKYIMTMEDLRKTKIWTWSGYPLIEAVAKIMEYGTTVPLGFPDVLMGLKTGLIETFFSPLYAAVATQWYQYAKYINLAPVAYTPGGALLDKKTFKSLPDDFQKVYIDTAEQTIAKCSDIIRKEHMNALEGMKKRGIQVLDPPPEVRLENEKKAIEIYAKVGEQFYPKWLFDNVMDLLTEYRSKQK
jgi:TRAP-type C4-dicarboxylate transport system substrate-binding protein